MDPTTVPDEAWLEAATVGGVTRLAAHGAWTVDNLSTLEREAVTAASSAKGRVVLDLSGVSRIDTAGAWLVHRLSTMVKAEGLAFEEIGISDNARRLLAAVDFTGDLPAPPRRKFRPLRLLELLGETTVNGWADFQQGMGILGGVVRGIFRAILKPSRFRFTSIVFHVDRTGLQAVPIIFLMSFLIGGIVAQQGIFQLSFFGATIFVVDLVGILVLRELGVLLTAIMLAGRSGSAYTAEIGSMKMREELDALTVIGLDPTEVLIMPRIIALVIVLPMLTFISDIAALMGGALVCYIYADMSFQTFILQLRDAVALNTLLVGILKAPFMALIIGIVAATEGLAVQGSTDSLGRKTTSSVVKAIFMVIVVDGIFAVFFAAIAY
ncbi:MAG: MlaE family lipid ABC transporter permease subunit [Rhizobiales bacterium]|nr:MlaE family lipid ABC transporter permease subunit [Hyphomicrobiales bacterium]